MKTPKQVIVDLETTGLNPNEGAEIFAYCIGYTTGEVNVYRYGEAIDAKQVMQRLLDNCDIEKVAHNLKFEYRFLTHPSSGYRVPDKTVWHDTMIMHQMLRNLSPSHAIDFLADVYFHYFIEYKGHRYNAKEIDKEVHEQAISRGGNWKNVDKDLMEIYQFSDGQREALLFNLLYPEISKSEKLYESYRIEIELIKTTIRIEDYGIYVDRENTKKLCQKLKTRFSELVEEVKLTYGEYYNLNSEKQLNHLLFNVLKYPVIDNTPKGKPRTNKDTLFALKEAFPNDKIFDLVLEWRSVTDGIALTRKYLNLTERSNIIHTTINTNKARTGRQSSQNPPLQNVSRDSGMKNPFAVPLRSCFRARPKRVMWFFDYKGIEMRLIIERSGCRSMLEELLKGNDPHNIARDIFYNIVNGEVLTDEKKFTSGVPQPSGRLVRVKLSQDEIDGKYRSAAKNAHFALAYGARPASLAVTLRWPEHLVLQNLVAYEERFPEIYHFAHTSMQKAKKLGYVLTPHGRRIYVPLDRLHAAADYDIQGTAAEIMKRGEVAVDKFLHDELNDEVRIVLTIHDELVLCAPDYPPSVKRQVVQKISELMTYMPAIEVPLETEQKETHGAWNEAKKMEI